MQLCEQRTREEPENEALCMYNYNPDVNGKSLTMSRKNILDCSRERETEQNEAGSV